MIRRNLNTGPLDRTPRILRCQGFSLVEIMMSLVLMGIGMALALPSYRDMVEKRQVTNGAEQVASFINVAQGAAMKTNQVVTVSYSRTADDEWCIGAVSGETACNCAVTDPDDVNFNCQIGSQTYILDNSHAGDRELVHSVTGDGAYAFDPIRGLFVDLDDSLQMELRSPSDQFRLNVVVNNTGRVILCSNSADHAIPGYAVCPAQPVEVEVAES